MCNDSVSKNFEEIFEDIQGPSLAEIGYAQIQLRLSLGLITFLWAMTPYFSFIKGKQEETQQTV